MLADYIIRVGIALSVLFNVILGGKSNQAFSARNWQWMINDKPNLVWLIDRIFWFEKDHCKESWIFWNTMHDSYTSTIDKD